MSSNTEYSSNKGNELSKDSKSPPSGDLGGRITVHSPGTVANLVCGFDILGLALNEPYDIMEVKLLDEPKVIIHNRDEYNLPTDPEKNVAGVVFLAAMEKVGGNYGFEVTIEKHIKPGSGIGSSAASAAGAAVAANHLLGNIFSSDDVVQLAMNGEKLASGVKHADNIAPFYPSTGYRFYSFS
jgi:homoserine kinase